MDIEKYSKTALQYYCGAVPEMLSRHLSNCQFTTFLDCGCGDGSLLNILFKENILSNKKTFAIDLSRDRIERIKLLDTKIVATIDNAEEMKTIENDSIDFFVSTSVIEHLDDRKMADSIYRVVKNNGLIYITSVFKKWYGWYYHRNKGKWVIDPTHLREYKKDEELLGLFSNDLFQLLENKKTLLRFSVTDFFIKRIGVKNRNFYNKSKVFKVLRKIKVPIPGYYYWEIVLKKHEKTKEE